MDKYYHKWILYNEPNRAELEAQKKTIPSDYSVVRIRCFHPISQLIRKN